MEVLKQNSLYNYLKQKCLFSKMESRSYLVVGTNGKGKDIRERCRG
jgi:hypothetical protein